MTQVEAWQMFWLGFASAVFLGCGVAIAMFLRNYDKSKKETD